MKRMMMGVVFAVLAAMWLAACGDDTQSVQEAEEEAARIAAEAEASATRQLGIELADAMRTARTAAQAYVREDGAQQERSGTRVTEAIAEVDRLCSGRHPGGGRPQLANADRARFEGPCLKFAALNTYGDLISEALAIINEVIELIPPRGVEGE